MHVRRALALFQEHAAQARRLSPRTVSSYTSDLKQFIAWLGTQDDVSVEVGKIPPADIEQWVASRQHVCPATLQRNLSSLSGLFRFLAKRRLVPHNPVSLVDKPRCPERHPHPLTEERLKRLLAVVQDTRERAILLTLALLGVRRGELLQLNVRDVDLTANRIHIQHAKGGRYRVLPIPAQLKPALEQYLAEHLRPADEALFLGCHGRRLSRSALGRLFDGWLQAAGLADEGLTPHSCRHGAALRWLKAGLSLRHFQLLLGHRDIAVTAGYLRLTVDDLAEQLATKVPSVNREREAGLGCSAIDPVWDDLLSRLSEPQRQALLSVARSMAAGPEASRA
jgi:site-specific recombinase XerD